MKKDGRVFVLDFDGTLTDTEAEARPFNEHYWQRFSQELDIKPKDIQRFRSSLELWIARSPDRHGWIHEGRIVAPAQSDPYLLTRTTARLIAIIQGFSEQAFVDLHEPLFAESYKKAGIAFRRGAAAFLARFRERHVYIVTNSGTASVKRHIETLGPDFSWLIERICGEARKFATHDAALDLVPVEMRIEGLKRPIFLRRVHYYRVLDSLQRKYDISWSHMTVLGDILEMDGALPLALGANFVLVGTGTTPAHEREYARNHKAASFSPDLQELASLLKV